MSRCSPLVVLIAFCGPALCPASALAQAVAADEFQLRGKVVNSATGQPISGALVQVADERSQFSGDDGGFEFKGLPRGQYSVAARKPGFFNNQQLRRWNAGANPMLTVPTEGDVILKLTPEGIIYGELKKQDGEPAERFQVRAMRWRIEDGVKRLEAAAATTTDDRGSFRIAELTPGSYYLMFPPERSGSWSNYDALAPNRKEEGYGRQYYPGVSDRASASAIEIRPGDQVHIAQALRPQPLFQVRGIVRGASLDQGFGLDLTNQDGDTVQRAVRIDKGTGEFQIEGVPAGNYLLSATGLMRVGAGLAPPTQPPSAFLPVPVQGDVSGLVLTLGPGISAGVQVDDETVTDANLNSGSSSNKALQVGLTMIPEEYPRFARTISASSTAGVPGAMTGFHGLVPGTYRVKAQPYGAAYVAALRCGDADLLRDDLVVSPGAALPPIEVTLRNDGAQLNVTVTEDGRPTVAGVVIYPEEYPRQASLMPTNDSGSATAWDLAPGTYQVVAVRDAGDLDFRNPAVMEAYLDKASVVTLTPLGKATVRVEAQPADEPQ